MSGGGSEQGGSLEYTPTWVVAAVCTVIVAISLAVERLLHYVGKYLIKKRQRSLFEALDKVKGELMLLGFISLLLTVFQNLITEICVPEHVVSNMLPCAPKIAATGYESNSTTTTQHFFNARVFGTARRLLAQETTGQQLSYCAEKLNLSIDAAGYLISRQHVRRVIAGRVPLFAVEAIHHLHIFIFVLAIVHLVFSVFTFLFGRAKIRQWQNWEHHIAKVHYDTQVLKQKVTHVHQHGKDSIVMGWVVPYGFCLTQEELSFFCVWVITIICDLFDMDVLLGVSMGHSFFKQFYASVTKSDYATLRLGFFITHCKGIPEFNFHEYMLWAIEDDFKQVVGISWYLWIFVVIFLLLNIDDWHTYFWIAFIPFILLLAVGTMLEHVITQLADEVAEKHLAIEEDWAVRQSDEHFWFHRPQIILYLIHFILFQNAFEIAFFFWILVQYGWDSCIMGQAGYIIPRLVIGVSIQLLCSYSTLPLYAIVTRIGSSYNKGIFDEEVRVRILDWAQKAGRQERLKVPGYGSTIQANSHDGSTIQHKFAEGLRAAGEGSNQSSSHNGSTVGIQLDIVAPNGSTNDEIQPTLGIQLGRVAHNGSTNDEIQPSDE